MENLSDIIQGLSSKSQKERFQALQKLGEQVVYVPATSFDRKTAEETKKVKIVHYSIAEKNIIPIFTQEEVFFEYINQNSYQCFTLPLADLCLTVPKDYWLIIDQDLSSEITLAPEDIKIISGETPAELPEDKIQEKEDEDFPILADEYEDLPEDHENINYSEESSFNPYLIKQKNVDHSEVKANLKTILEKYPCVIEGYYVSEIEDITALGLVSENLSLEDRFNLIEEVAHISREYFGEAGIIEVFDDLASYSSSSWELFKTVASFYEKPKNSQKSIPLSSKIEWGKLRTYEEQNITTLEADNEEEQEEDSRFTSKSFGFFGRNKNPKL